MLKKELADLRLSGVGGGKSAEASRLAQAQIAALQSDKEILRLEKAALENRVKQMSGGTAISSTVLSQSGLKTPAVSAVGT